MIFAFLKDLGGDKQTAAIIHVFCGIPQIAAAWFFFLFLRASDEKEPREKLILAGKLQMVGIIVQGVVGILDALNCFGSYPNVSVTGSDDASLALLETKS